MDYGKIGKRLADRASGAPPEPKGDEDGDAKGDGLDEAFTPKQAAAVRAYVKACMDE